MSTAVTSIYARLAHLFGISVIYLIVYDLRPLAGRGLSVGLSHGLIPAGSADTYSRIVCDSLYALMLVQKMEALE